jgi:hypothetical protein
MNTPTNMPTTPQTTAMMENCRTTVSLYTACCDEFIGHLSFFKQYPQEACKAP